MTLWLTVLAHASEPRAIVWGGGPTPEDGATWLARWQQESPDYADLITLAPGWPKLVESGSMPGMKPGFHVVVLGVCLAGDEQPALALLKALHAGTYVRELDGPAPASGCPTVANGVTLRQREVVEQGRSAAVVLSVGAHIPEVAGGESASGAIEGWVLAIGRDADGARTAFHVLGMNQARPSGGFGSSADVRVLGVEGGRILVESVSRLSTVECGTPSTTTRSSIGLVDGAFDLTEATKEQPPFCIQ